MEGAQAMDSKLFITNSLRENSDVGHSEPDLDDPSSLVPTSDRRAVPRYLCDYPARVVSTDRSIAVDGQIVNISVGGAQVEVAYPQDGPPTIILHERANDELYDCELCWNSGHSIGLQFLDMFGPARRRMFFAGQKLCGQGRKEAERLAQTDAAALIRDEGDQAYWEARRRERDIAVPNGSTHAWRTAAHWRRVALIIAKRTGRPGSLPRCE